MSSGSDEYESLKKIQDALERGFQKDPKWDLYRDVTRAINNYERKVAATQPSPDHPPRKVVKNRTIRKTKIKARRRKSHAAMALDIITQSKRPVTSSELVEALEKAGNPVGGDRKTTNLSSVLSKDKRFESVFWPPSSQSRAWWLRDHPLPSPSVETLLRDQETVAASNLARTAESFNMEDE